MWKNEKGKEKKKRNKKVEKEKHDAKMKKSNHLRNLKIKITERQHEAVQRERGKERVSSLFIIVHTYSR